MDSDSQNRSESPDIIYGRLLEAAHLFGYSGERATDSFEWLIDDGRWQQVGGGFTDINDFLASIAAQSSQFSYSIEQRKRVANKLAELQASQRKTAGALGVSQKTVSRDLQPESHDSQADDTEPPDQGKEHEGESHDSPDHLKTDPADVAGAAKKASEKKQRASQREQQRDEKRTATRAQPPDQRYQSHTVDISNLHEKVDGPVDVIITDPPYPKQYLWTFGELARQAKALLKPGGLCVVMSGQSYLPAVMAYLAEHLDYYWTGAYMLPGQPTPLRQRNVNCSWKPLLIYTNGDANPRLFGDVMTSERNEKDWHDWGQSISGMLDIVDRLTEPGDLILDPFLGGGATAVAALELDRRFVGADVDEEQVKLSDARVGEWFDGTTT